MVHQIQLTEEVYQKALQRAKESGFESINDYVSDFIVHDFEEEGEVDFGPEVDASLRRISDEMKAGGPSYTLEEVHEHLQQFRADWLKNNSAV